MFIANELDLLMTKKKVYANVERNRSTLSTKGSLLNVRLVLTSF